MDGARQPGGSATEALSELERFLAQAAAAGLGLPEIEAAAERRGRELVRAAVQQHLDARGDGDIGPAVCADGPDGPVRLSYKKRHTRSIVTVFGKVSLTRIGYGAPGCASIHPLDVELRLPGRSFSYEVCRRLVRAAVSCPFSEAVDLLRDMTGVQVPKRSAEQIITEAAADFESFYAAEPAADLAGGDILVGAIDCKGIPMVKPHKADKVVRRGKGHKPNKKKMATVGAVFAQPPRVRTPQTVLDSLFNPADSPADDDTGNAGPGSRAQPKHKRVWASLTAGKDAFIADVHADMTHRDPGRGHTWVLVTDGERALQRRVMAAFADIPLVLDLLHVLEKLWKAAYVFHPETSPEAAAFVRERAERILTGQSGQVVKGLRQMATKRQLSAANAKTLHGVADYYHHNRTRMHYDRYLANGWPIASGSVEGACKNLIRDRFERSGMRWTPTTAEAMLKMRALYLSGDYDTYWNWHIEQDQKRLYPAHRRLDEK